MTFEPIHSARLNNFAWGAIQLDGGLAKDSYVQISPNSDLTAESQDAGSFNTSISLLSDRSATITFQLQAQSQANKLLASVVRQDTLNNGKTIHNITVTTNGTLYLYEMIGCYIKARPEETKSEDMSGVTNTWMFYCSELRERQIEDSVFSADVTSGISDSVSVTVQNSITIL